MIRIISRDAVFSRMLTILFSKDVRVSVSARTEDIFKNDVCLWDAESMGAPPLELPALCVVITADEDLEISPPALRVLRPFKLDELKKYILEFMSASGKGNEELCFDDAAQSVSYAGETVKFSPVEYTLLRKLYDADGQLVSKEDAASVFESEESNVLEVYIYYLRKKLKKLPRRPEIVTVRGKGYILKKGDLN